MLRTVLSAFIFSAAVNTMLTTGAVATEDYPIHPDSHSQDGVPQGEIKGPFEWHSKLFPGTVREYAIYVPAQYDAKKPACSMIVQDGLRKAEQWKIPTVLANLIHQGDVPAQIGIFVSPGVVQATSENSQPRFNRSFEYDGMGDRCARFLLEEMLPEVSKSYNRSTDPNDRLIAGSSSGAIAAFTAAWERPNEFRRVFSAVGTYVLLRGGDQYPSLIRKFENKLLRIDLQDGSNDVDIYAGSWWVANQAMLSSLRYSGYDVANNWDEGGHHEKHSNAIMPDALREGIPKRSSQAFLQHVVRSLSFPAKTGNWSVRGINTLTAPRSTRRAKHSLPTAKPARSTSSSWTEVSRYSQKPAKESAA